MKQVSELIDDIAQVASLPLEESDRWSRAEVVQAMNLAMDEKVVPELLRFNNEHLVVRQTFPLSATTYPTMQIPVPRRAYGRQLREIKYLPAGQTSMLREINLTQTTLPEKDQVYGPSYTFGMPYSFYFQNDTVNLLTDPASATGTLVFYYFLTPSTLVNKTTEFANITNVSYNSGSGVFTFTATSAGSEFDTYAGSDGMVKLYDVYRRSTGVIIYRDLPLTKGTGIFTVTGSLGADDAGIIKSYQDGGMPVSGPYAADVLLLPAGQSQFSTLPSEFDTLLVYHTVSRILESLGDTEGLQVNEQRVKNAYANISNIMGASRVKGEPKVVVNRRGIGDVQRWSWWRGRWWR